MRASAAVGLGLCAAIFLMWAAGLAGGYDVVADVDVSRGSLLPSAAHWLGTDHLGRSVAWRLVVGAQAFVGPGALAASVALGAGVTLGALSGWVGGLVADALRFTVGVLASLPRLVLVLLAGSIFGTDLFTLGVAVGVACVPMVAEAVHARLESFRRAEFVLAARAHGVPPWRVLLIHLLWVNARALILRQGLAVFSWFLLVETTLSYVGGFGVAEPRPSWGNMIAFEWTVRDGNPWATRAPALAIWLGVLGPLLFAESLVESADRDEAEDG